MKIIEFDYRVGVLDHAFEEQNARSQQVMNSFSCSETSLTNLSIELTKHLFDQKYHHEQVQQEVAWIKRNINQKQ